MNKKKLFFLSFLVALSWAKTLHSQEIQLNEAPEVTRLMKAWVNHNRIEPGIDGWRVQIMASTDRVQAEQARTRFRTSYPEVSAGWVQEQPYYKLRVGAFRTRLEALSFINELAGWPGAYPARDAKIHPRDFLEQ